MSGTARALAENRLETWFEPIVDTSGHRIMGHDCLVFVPNGVTPGDVAPTDVCAPWLAIRSAARQSRTSTYFVRFHGSWFDDPDHSAASTEDYVHGSGLKPRNIVFEMEELDLARDAKPIRRILDDYRAHGFKFSLDIAEPGAKCLGSVCDFRPDYIRINRNLVHNSDKLPFAATIRKLVDFADQIDARAIAEGVDRVRLLENLWLLGVEIVQGEVLGGRSREIIQTEWDLACANRVQGPPLAHSHAAPMSADLY